MSLKLYYHPLSSFSMKVLMAFYENEVPFEPVLLEPNSAVSKTALLDLWPVGKFPVLRDEARSQTVPESSIIIEYLALHYPGPVRLVPEDPGQAIWARLLDRFFDLNVNAQMQKVVGNRLRPEGMKDPAGTEHALGQLKTACALVDREIVGKHWALGEEFTMADCAAGPALYYANRVLPFAEMFPHTFAYLERLQARPSFARALREAEPYFPLFPKG